MAATLVWGWALFGVPFHLAHPLLFLVAVPVTVLALGMLGLLLASTFVLLRNANALANPLDYPVWLLSGMLTPLTVLPGWTRPLSYALATTWGARALRGASAGGAVWTPAAAALGLGLLYVLAGSLALVRVERRARAAATLALA